MYSYLLKYCYKKPCTHEYITSTTEYFFFFKFQSDREKKLIVSPSSVSNAPHLSFLRLEKSGLIYFFRCQNQNIGIFMLKMKKRCPIMFWQKSGLICFGGNKNISKKPACLICFSYKWPEKHLFIFLPYPNI